MSTPVEANSTPPVDASIDARPAPANGGPTQPAAAPPVLSPGISPKLGAAAIGGAIATIAGVAIGHFIPAIATLELSALVGAIGTLLSFLVGYYMPDPLRHAGSAAMSIASA